jgi:hypothetical protein
MCRSPILRPAGCLLGPPSLHEKLWKFCVLPGWPEAVSGTVTTQEKRKPSRHCLAWAA